MLRAMSPDRSHYLVPSSGLRAGEYPGHREPEAARRRLGRLLATGVDCFVDLTEPGELVPYDAILREIHAGAEHRRFPVRDMSVPPTTAAMLAILDAIDDAL